MPLNSARSATLGGVDVLVSDIAAAHGTSPFVSVYPWSPGYGMKYADPPTAIPSFSIGVTFSPDATDIVVGHIGGTLVSAYP